MGILTRFKDIMTSNVNALLDKCEDPEKMIDQYLRNLERDLGKVKAETASVMAEEKRAKRELEECVQEAEKMQKYAIKALTAGEEGDAKAFLERKQEILSKQQALQQSYALAKENADKMRQLHDKLTKDMGELNARRDAIKAKVKAAKAQQKMNKIHTGAAGAAAGFSAFDRMEAKAQDMLDEAAAMAELNQSAQENDIENLMSKYEETDAPNAVEDELAALKAQMGLL